MLIRILASGAGNSAKLSLQERASLKNNTSPPPKQIGYQQPQHSPQQIYPSAQPSYESAYEEKSAYHEPEYEQPAPAYGQAPAPSYNQAPSYGQLSHQPAPAGGLVSPRAAPTPPPSRAKYVLALYDYDAQAEGDLTFKKDDKIELVNRTEDANDWWTGRLRGAIGVFPGKKIYDVVIQFSCLLTFHSITIGNYVQEV